MKKWLRLAASAGLCVSSAWAVDWKELRPQGFVSDFAGVVDTDSKSKLEDYCRLVQRSTGVRITLVAISSLEGEPVEDVARTIFRAWGDTPEKDQRVMLLLTVTDRRDWVETGAGLAPAFTDGLPARILRETRLALRQRDFTEAMRAAADTIGSAAARAHGLTLGAHLPRRVRWSLSDSIPWIAVAGGLLMLAWLMLAGNPAGYGGFGSRGLLPALVRARTMRRSTWGSRGSGGFGGYDSGDGSGGFGGGACSDW